MIIYIIKNKVNNKQYVGQTRNALKKRWSDHIGAANRGSLAPIHKAIRKYGLDKFELNILYKCSSLNEMNQKEIELIKSLKPKYNIHHGGNSTFTEEHRLRVIEAMKRPEVRAKILTIKTDPTVNKKLRDALKAKVHSNLDTVNAMIAGGMQFAKKIKSINLETKEEHIFTSQRDAGRKLNIPNSSIRKVLKGTLVQSHGFTFEYI